VLGPEQLVSTVDAAVADVNLSGFRDSVRQSFSLEPRSERGYDISGVRLEPSSVVVDIRIIRQSTNATLPVVPDIIGSPASGFWVSQVRVTPQIVAVFGPPDLMSQTVAIRTAPIDVTNLAGPVTRTANLSAPSGIVLIDRTAVQVEVNIQPLPGNGKVLVAPQVRALGSGLNARVDVSSVEVTASGAGPVLRDLSANRVAVFLNLEERGPGTHEIEPQVELPLGLQLVGVSPTRVRVIVEPER